MDNEIWLIIVIVESAVLVSMFFVIGFYKNLVTEEIEKRLNYEGIIKNLQTQLYDAKNAITDYRKEYKELQEIECAYRKEYKELQETGCAIDTKIKSLINEIDSFENELPKDNDETQTLVRIIKPNNIIKVINDTGSDALLTLKPLKK